MQAVKLFIPGSYYDSQIYSGYLYLWSNSGSIITINWNKLIKDINVGKRLQIALNYALQQSSHLYHNINQTLLIDPDVRDIVIKKFQELSKKTLEISKEQLQKFTVCEQDNPLPFPHANNLIYKSVLYVASQDGVMATSCHDYDEKFSISSKIIKIWDAPTLDFAVYADTLALAAGSEGTFECQIAQASLQYGPFQEEPSLVLPQHSNSVHWSYASIFSSSYYNEGYLAEYMWKPISERESKRELREIIPSHEIFQHETSGSDVKSFTWGVQDKVCSITQDTVEIVRFKPYQAKTENRFKHLGDIKINKKMLQNKISEVISADSGFFGIIIEGEDGLLVINSSQEMAWFPGEPVNWRIFPNSQNYTNQLHVIYDEVLCIHSFNNDYFVNQETKKIGIRYYARGTTWLKNRVTYTPDEGETLQTVESSKEVDASELKNKDNDFNDFNPPEITDDIPF